MKRHRILRKKNVTADATERLSQSADKLAEASAILLRVARQLEEYTCVINKEQSNVAAPSLEARHPVIDIPRPIIQPERDSDVTAKKLPQRNADPVASKTETARVPKRQKQKAKIAERRSCSRPAAPNPELTELSDPRPQNYRHPDSFEQQGVRVIVRTKEDGTIEVDMSEWDAHLAEARLHPDAPANSTWVSFFQGVLEPNEVLRQRKSAQAACRVLWLEAETEGHLAGFHPGLLLARDFLICNSIDRQYLSHRLDLSSAVLERLLVGEQSVTPSIAKKLSEVFDLPEAWWLELQGRYDNHPSVPEPRLDEIGPYEVVSDA